MICSFCGLGYLNSSRFPHESGENQNFIVYVGMMLCITFAPTTGLAQSSFVRQFLWQAATQ